MAAVPIHPNMKAYTVPPDPLLRKSQTSSGRQTPWAYSLLQRPGEGAARMSISGEERKKFIKVRLTQVSPPKSQEGCN